MNAARARPMVHPNDSIDALEHCVRHSLAGVLGREELGLELIAIAEDLVPPQKTITVTTKGKADA